MNTVKEIRRENLQVLVNQYGSMKKLNEILGRKDNTLTQILNESVHTETLRKKQMGDKIAREIETKLNLGYGWMDANHAKENFPEETDLIYLRKLDVNACCGINGATNDETNEASVELLGVNRSWFRENVDRIRNQGYELITARGDSMEPTFKNGDLIIIDRLDLDVTREGIFCVLVDGDLFVKRLQRVPKAIRFVSDNRFYDSFDIKREEFDVRVKVIGRVVNSMNLKRYD